MLPIGHESGTFYLLEIKTNAYAGNFCREMAAYLFGKIEAGHEKTYRACAAAGGFEDIRSHSRYGQVPADMEWFIDRLMPLNTGDHDIEEGWWSTCDGDGARSVTFMLDKSPSTEQLEAVLSRAKNFTGDCTGKSVLLSENSLPSKVSEVTLRELTIVHEVNDKPIFSVH